MDTLSTKITGSSIKEHIASLGNIFESNLTSMGNKVQQLGDIIVPYVQIFQTEFAGVGTSVVNATKSVLSALGDMYGGFGSAQSVQNFGDIVKLVADKIKDASAWIQDHSKQILLVVWLFHSFSLEKRLQKELKKSSLAVIRLVENLQLSSLLQ